MPRVHVRTLGSGPRVLLVHGSVHQQRHVGGAADLAAGYTLRHPRSARLPAGPAARTRSTRRSRREELAPLLGEASHLLGHSYGGVISLLRRARAAARVRSLAVIEPPCFGLARGHPAVDETFAAYEDVYRVAAGDPGAFLAGFAALFGPAGPRAGPAPARTGAGRAGADGRALALAAEIPLERLAAAGFPVLVCSSGGHPAYEVALRRARGALGAERVVLPGAGHAVHRAPGFNERYADFLRRS